jgi:D-glycero-D-manno-heptose 1,7-bisphosphate phosphatase
MSKGPLIILDRDGVLNEMLTEAATGLPDSPMNPSEVKLFSYVPKCLKALNDMGYTLRIATNQPAAAKGKTSFEELQAAHDQVVALAGAEGAVILSSHICWHRREDLCSCRKPATGLLEEALGLQKYWDAAQTWMVGDRAVDIQAGVSAGLKTALLAKESAELKKQLEQAQVSPTFWGADLRDFVEHLRKLPK